MVVALSSSDVIALMSIFQKYIIRFCSSGGI